MNSELGFFECHRLIIHEDASYHWLCDELSHSIMAPFLLRSQIATMSFNEIRVYRWIKALSDWWTVCILSIFNYRMVLQMKHGYQEKYWYNCKIIGTFPFTHFEICFTTKWTRFKKVCMSFFRSWGVQTKKKHSWLFFFLDSLSSMYGHGGTSLD